MSKIFNWVTTPIHTRNTIVVILFLFGVATIVLAVYGSVRICTLQERFDTIKL